MTIRKAASLINQNRKRRIIAGLVAFAVLLFMLLSIFFIAYEADHDCTGENCPVCALIQMSEDNLRQLGSGTGAPFAVVAHVTFIQMILPLSASSVITSTPVSRKIRLNN